MTLPRVVNMNTLSRSLLRLSLKNYFARSCSTNGSSGSRVGIVGVPFEKGQRNLGVGRGPEVLRNGGILQDLLSFGCDVRDFGNVDYELKRKPNPISNMLEYDDFAACMEKVSEKVRDVLADGRLCLSLGGDHSMGVGTVDGHVQAKGEVSVLWVDAHADINTNSTSASGNVHGMPVALLAKELSDYWPYLPGMDWQVPRVSIKNIAYIGLRSVDEYEMLILEKFGITAFAMEDVERLGIHEVTQRALEAINPNGDRSLHVSFDIDSLDPLEAPSTGTRVRGGLSLREGIHIMETVYASGTLGAMDLVEVNPNIGSEHDVKVTVEAARQVVRAGFGYKRRGMKPLLTQEIPGLQKQ